MGKLAALLAAAVLFFTLGVCISGQAEAPAENAEIVLNV